MLATTNNPARGRSNSARGCDYARFAIPAKLAFNSRSAKPIRVFLREPGRPGSGLRSGRQRGVQRGPFAADPRAYENDRCDHCNEHDSEQHGVLDERRAFFVVAKLCESTKQFTHFITPPKK